MSAYMALPKSGRGAGVVVLQEIFGVTQAMKDICDFLAKRQFLAICPDLYWNVQADAVIPESDPEKGRALRQKVDDMAIVRDIGAAVDFLRKHPANSMGTVGVVGYCWGGLLAYLTATEKNVDAAVCYYGVGIQNHLDKAKNIECSMLLHYAGQDAYAGPEVAAQVKATLNPKKTTVFEYPTAGHAFARPGGAHYHHASADLADMRTLSFLVDRLIGKRPDSKGVAL